MLCKLLLLYHQAHAGVVYAVSHDGNRIFSTGNVTQFAHIKRMT